MKKFGKEHIYLDKNGNWIDFSETLIAESEAKGFTNYLEFYPLILILKMRKEFVKHIIEGVGN